ncbi:hypothetical protein MVEN_01330100 [Mycena venus]|uniref:Uncharacterized protein n=1 Tax=Mycena venus TaxID=2733690 RepID=A0A8H7CWU5_9AGAR|nr:hypothetical protein MVEN_01330100 [Mycena venus]
MANILAAQISNPILPRELERMIFEIAALARLTSIPTLILVAARVKEWVEPILYRVVLIEVMFARPLLGFPIFSGSIMAKAMEIKPQAFLRNSVKSLCLEYHTVFSLVQTILTTCTRISNLFMGYRPYSHLNALGALECLRRLAVPFRDVRRSLPLEGPHPLFRNVTHLELLSTLPGPVPHRDILAITASLPLMPHLTHVAFHTAPKDPAFYTALHANERLQCIVFRLNFAAASDVGNTQGFADDIRFVCVRGGFGDSRNAWLVGAHSGDDFWALADTFIAARRAKKVDHTRYCVDVDDTDDSWRT